MTKWLSEPPAIGIGFRVIKERCEGEYRIIEEFEVMQYAVCQSGADGDILNAVADQNRQAAQSPAIEPVTKEGSNANSESNEPGHEKETGRG